MQEALTTMLRMQHRMNTRVHPQWVAQGFAWHRAIWVECAELVDHHGYKWWKHQEPDMEQVQLEVVDIWHFGMSAYFEGDAPIEQLAESIMGVWPVAPQELGILEASEALAAVAAGEKRFCIVSFASLLSAVDLDFAGLYRHYLGKNVLNFFRQDHGYKEGSYRKLWAGR